MCGIKSLMLFESKQSSTSTTNIYLNNKLVLVLNYLSGRKMRPQKDWAKAGAKHMKEVQCTRWEFGILCEA